MLCLRASSPAKGLISREACIGFHRTSAISIHLLYQIIGLTKLDSGYVFISRRLFPIRVRGLEHRVGHFQPPRRSPAHRYDFSLALKPYGLDNCHCIGRRDDGSPAYGQEGALEATHLWEAGLQYSAKLQVRCSASEKLSVFHSYNLNPVLNMSRGEKAFFRALNVSS